MNTFLKTALSLTKIVALVALFYLFVSMLFSQNITQWLIGLFVLIFITVPTVFVIFFKDKLLPNHPKLASFWKVFKVIYIVSIILYVTMVSIGHWNVGELIKTKNTVNFINSKKITIDDVMGKNLPPAPNQEVNDSTIAGIDANNNYIRDDVELAIFQKYPNSAKIRSAELQYAQEIEDKLNNVFNNDTWVAMAKSENNGISCIVELSFDSYENTKDQIDESDSWTSEVENLVFNTPLRKEKRDTVDKLYQTSYIVGDGECDISPLSLPD